MVHRHEEEEEVVNQVEVEIEVEVVVEVVEEEVEVDHHQDDHHYEGTGMRSIGREEIYGLEFTCHYFMQTVKYERRGFVGGRRIWVGEWAYHGKDESG